jgi:hypothetical protein
MKNRLFLTLSLMIAGFALSIAASANAQISPNNQYTVKRKVTLPCQASNKFAVEIGAGQPPRLGRESNSRVESAGG